MQQGRPALVDNRSIILNTQRAHKAKNVEMNQVYLQSYDLFTWTSGGAGDNCLICIAEELERCDFDWLRSIVSTLFCMQQTGAYFEQRTHVVCETGLVGSGGMSSHHI